MKKRIPLLLFLIAAFPCFLSVPAYAHKGRTDSNGGHTDHGSGEYHYHHGYEAHAHFDIDMDGDIDCPFDFVDNTNHGGSNSTNSSSNRTDGMSYKDGYKIGYNTGYDDGYQAGQEYIDQEKSTSYENGFKDGEAAAMNTLEPTIKERVKETIKSWVVLGILAIIFVVYPAWITISEMFSLLYDRYKARKRDTSQPKVMQSAPPKKPKERKNPDPFTYELNPNPPQPPNLGPTKEEYSQVTRSSFIDAVAYKNGNLYVKLKNTGCYMYYNVPKNVYTSFLAAESMGSFYNENIVNNYPYSHI